MKSFPFYWHMRSSCGFEKPGWVGQAGWEGWPPVVVGPSGRWLVGAPSGLPPSPSAASVTSPTASLGSPLGISVFCDHGSLSSPRLTSLWVSSLGPCSTRMLLLAMTQNFQETKKKKNQAELWGSVLSVSCPLSCWSPGQCLLRETLRGVQCAVTVGVVQSTATAPAAPNTDKKIRRVGTFRISAATCSYAGASKFLLLSIVDDNGSAWTFAVTQGWEIRLSWTFCFSKAHFCKVVHKPTNTEFSVPGWHIKDVNLVFCLYYIIPFKRKTPLVPFIWLLRVSCRDV